MGTAQAKADAAEVRSADRFSIKLDTVMRELGAPDQPVRLNNISVQGFAGATTYRFSRPCVVAVALPGLGDVKARVIWTGGDTVGGEFLTPLDLDALDHSLGEMTRGGF